MKQIILLSLLTIWASSGTQAQSKHRLFEFYEGYIINQDGKKETGFIQYLDETDRYKKVVFRKTLKDKSRKFKPKDIKAYKVADVMYHAIEYKDVIFKDLKFLVLEQEGCINKYSIRSLEEGQWNTKRIYLKNGKAVSADIFAMNFAEKMSDFIKDDKVLSEKVKNKEKGYRILAIEAIINEYNANCKTKN